MSNRFAALSDESSALSARARKQSGLKPIVAGGSAGQYSAAGPVTSRASAGYSAYGEKAAQPSQTKKVHSATPAEIAAAHVSQANKAVVDDIKKAIVSIFWPNPSSYDIDDANVLSKYKLFMMGNKVFSVSVKSGGQWVPYSGQKLVGRLIWNANKLGQTDILDYLAPYLINYRQGPPASWDDLKELIMQLYFRDPETSRDFVFFMAINHPHDDKVVKVVAKDEALISNPDYTGIEMYGEDLVKALYHNAQIQGIVDLFVNEALPYIEISQPTD